jgi:aromatase
VSTQQVESSTPAPAPALTPGHTDSSVDIHAGIDLVWRVTNDIEGWPLLFTEYAAAQILEVDGDTVRFRLTMHPDADGKVWSWVSERTPDVARREVVARRVEPGPFEFMNIRWTYTSLPDGGTRMRWVQEFRMRPQAPLDTAAMTERITRNSGVQMAVIKNRLEKLADVEPLSRRLCPPETTEDS